MKTKGNNYSYIFLCLAVIIAIFISIKVAAKETFWLDTKLAVLVANVPDTLHPFFLLVTELGDKKGIGIVALIVLIWLLFIKRHFLGAAALSLSTALGNEVNKLLKDWIARPRPDLEHFAHVDSLSFPSGHAMIGLVFYSFTAYLIQAEMKSAAAKRIVMTVTVLLLLLIGASRVILQVHYPTDVIAGYAFGYIWLFLSIYVYQLVKKRLRKT